MTAPQSPQQAGPELGEEARQDLEEMLENLPDGTITVRGILHAVEPHITALLTQARADERRKAESAPWLLDLVHAAETAGTELGCNGDHEGHEGCEACAWEALADAVPARVRNAADERASKP